MCQKRSVNGGGARNATVREVELKMVFNLIFFVIHLLKDLAMSLGFLTAIMNFMTQILRLMLTISSIFQTSCVAELEI